jgi:hypothetical protein
LKAKAEVEVKAEAGRYRFRGGGRGTVIVTNRVVATKMSGTTVAAISPTAFFGFTFL